MLIRSYKDSVFCILGLSDFPRGHRYFTFDMLETCSGDECSADLLLTGHMTINLEFEAPLKTTHVLMVYGYSPDSFDVDKTNHVRVATTVI